MPLKNNSKFTDNSRTIWQKMLLWIGRTGKWGWWCFKLAVLGRSESRDKIPVQYMQSQKLQRRKTKVHKISWCHALENNSKFMDNSGQYDRKMPLWIGRTGRWGWCFKALCRTVINLSYHYVQLGAQKIWIIRSHPVVDL